MSKTLNEMVHTIVDHYDSVNQAADAIGVHFATIDRLLNDKTTTAQARTTAKIEALYDEITAGEEPAPKEKITKLEIGKTYEIKIPKSGSSTVMMMIHRGVAKKEYRQFYQLDNDGKSITILKADLINDRTTVTPIDVPAKEVEEPVDVEYVPVVDDGPVEEVTEEEAIAEEPDKTTKMIEELMEEPAEEEESTPTIIGTTPAERLHSCLFIVELCDQKIAEAEKAKRDRAAILPLMDEIYKEFRA